MGRLVQRKCSINPVRTLELDYKFGSGFFQPPKQNGSKVISYRIHHTHKMSIRSIGVCLWAHRDAFLLLERLTLNCNYSYKNISLALVRMNRMAEWKQLAGFLVFPLFSLVYVLIFQHIPILSSMHREVQGDWPFFLEAGDFPEDSVRMGSRIWFFFFFVEWKPFIMKNFFFIVYFYIVSNPWISGIPKIHF